MELFLHFSFLSFFIAPLPITMNKVSCIHFNFLFFFFIVLFIRFTPKVFFTCWHCLVNAHQFYPRLQTQAKCLMQQITLGKSTRQKVQKNELNLREPIKQYSICSQFRLEWIITTSHLNLFFFRSTSNLNWVFDFFFLSNNNLRIKNEVFMKRKWCSGDWLNMHHLPLVERLGNRSLLI